MNGKRVIGAAVVLASIVPPVSAKEMGAGELYWMMLQLVAQHYIPGLAPSEEEMRKLRGKPDPPAARQGTGECEVLRRDPKASSQAPMLVSRPGKYCLDQDHAFECTQETNSCTGTMIQVLASDVDLDLRGHTLRMSGSRRYRGVNGAGRNIRVHHGRIEGAGVGIALMQNQGTAPGNAYPGMQVKPDDVFTDTGFVVEHIEFSNVLSAVEVAGSGNRISDNRIDAMLDATMAGGPPLALLSYGPSARVERNTFHLRELSPSWNGYAMYLRSAHGALVADNTVSVDGAATGTIGIGLSNSTGLALQRNLIGTEKITELDQRSSLQ